MNRPHFDLQIASATRELPSHEQFERWVDAVLDPRIAEPAAGVVIRIVDEAESRGLNREFRGIDRPTNVLSFPFEPPPGAPREALAGHLGDLVICAPVVIGEAAEQGKLAEAHWAHMVVHGLLHLLGYDHQNDAEAADMEERERSVLRRLGYPDPYANDRDS